MRQFFVYLVLMTLAMAIVPQIAFAGSLEQQRADFLLAEKQLENGDDAVFISLKESLQDYPLYPLLQYQWLKKHFEQTDNILGFLNTFKDTHQADLLKSQWLSYLAKQERWLDFIQNYKSNDNTALTCQYHWANFKTGQLLGALEAAKQLWLSNTSLPKECDSLMAEFTLSPSLTSQIVMQRFELALDKDNVLLAEALKRLMNKDDQHIADVWLQIHNNPLMLQQSETLNNTLQYKGHIFTHGVSKLIKTNLDLAISIWDMNKAQLIIGPPKEQQIERKIALALAVNHDGRAYVRLGSLTDQDAEIREWRIRSALLEQNWQHVNDALSALTPEEQQDPKWQYWLARSRNAIGSVFEAQEIYSRVAGDRSFYGFLASDTVNKPYQLSNKPVIVDVNELGNLLQLPDFKVIQELKYLDRELDAQHEWNFAIKKLNREQLKIAAKLAQQWQWDQLAITTLVKADYWDDVDLRFPINYLPQVQKNSVGQQLQPALVFGLMRQESMLDKNAQSAVGARGLMQIMPKTGQQIARELSEKWLSDAGLYTVDTNIKYGTYYFKQLLNRFNGHIALAIAAYNAGPNNVGKWLPLDKSIPADVWMETIPFKETRKYVASVLSYTMIYQQRIQNGSLKLKELLCDVQPAKN
ncbi:MAG: transglycosylase SLT domain-containing protein [Methylococcaceae bacterium]|nr:transglycosylase SLT domain-containing protein [Methylococcaceae bacterium]